jgi:hypothetical protein
MLFADLVLGDLANLRENVMVRKSFAWFFVLVAFAAIAKCALGQGFALDDTPQSDETLRSFFDFGTMLRREIAGADVAPGPSPTSPRLTMFRMPSGYLAAPITIISDDDTPSSGSTFNADDDGLPLQISFGNYIPYFDMVRRGDPGGVGYYKVHTQVQLVDLGFTYVSAVLQALTPMGAQSGGVSNGPTVLAPALAAFHDLGYGAGVHAYVGQNIVAMPGWREQMLSNFNCGIAMQHPVPFTRTDGSQGLFVFVQALGQYHGDGSRGDVRATTWEVIPGLQYRVNSNSWMSVGISRYQFVSWVWQY